MAAWERGVRGEGDITNENGKVRQGEIGKYFSNVLNPL